MSSGMASTRAMTVSYTCVRMSCILIIFVFYCVPLPSSLLYFSRRSCAHVPCLLLVCCGVCMYTFMFVNTHIYTNACILIYIYIHVYIYAYVHTYTYTYMHVNIFVVSRTACISGCRFKWSATNT